MPALLLDTSLGFRVIRNFDHTVLTTVYQISVVGSDRLSDLTDALGKTASE
jgi:hypothetical protein